MPWLSVQVKADAVKRNLDRFGKGLPKAAADPIRKTVEQARSAMSKPAPHPRYPINWDSERQRRAYFATDGFGKGIPSRRTGEYEHGWRVQENPSSERARYGYSLVNETPYGKYVGGNAYGYGQSQIHAGRWILLAETLHKFIDRLPQQVEDAVMIFAERSGLRGR